MWGCTDDIVMKYLERRSLICGRLKRLLVAGRAEMIYGFIIWGLWQVGTKKMLRTQLSQLGASGVVCDRRLPVKLKIFTRLYWDPLRHIVQRRGPYARTKKGYPREGRWVTGLYCGIPYIDRRWSEDTTKVVKCIKMKWALKDQTTVVRARYTCGGIYKHRITIRDVVKWDMKVAEV